jgi:hypothetical protein
VRFAVATVSPLGYPHSQAFAEVAETLHHALQALGHDSVLSTRLDNRRRRHIVLGANLLPRWPQQVPEDSILYNLEQISADSPWLSPSYLDLLRRHRVWDYSEANLRALADHGIRAELLPIGWMPQLERIAAEPLRDVDVLFYGSLGDRRRDALMRIEQAGLRLASLFNVYGPERDRWIARSRLVINLHHYPACLFEAVRVSYLLGNGACVVSERGSDTTLEQPYASAVAFCEYDALLPTCQRLLAAPAEQQRLREAGPALMRSRDLRPPLERCLRAG